MSTFLLQDEKSIAAALAVVRDASLSPAEKRELRDQIFSYATSRSDEALRTQIETRLASLVETTPVESVSIPENLPVAPVAISPTVNTVVTDKTAANIPSDTKVTTTGFSTGRQVPTFGMPVVPVPVVPPVVTTVPAKASVAPTIVPSQPSTPSPVVPSPMVDFTPSVTPTVVSAPSQPIPQAVVAEKLAVVAPAAVPTEELVPPYHEEAAVEKMRARISEIKQLINARVGNPVNLVDIDNTLGREYMNALLEAMKAVSGGGGDAVTLMNTLETAVAKVMRLLDEKAPTVPVVTPPKPSLPASPTVMPSAFDGTVTTDQLVPPPAPVTTRVIPIMPEEQIEVHPMTIASSRFKNVAPVAEVAPLKTPADLPTAQELKAQSGITDPLLDPDVDLGLDQLLSEWTLFKKSGVFGTGPKGRAHPLFLTLAPLQMPLILGGRFEGATTEIRQSITDYMNGWRYEQGIIYDAEETFEHYLRRVIRHILDVHTKG